MFLITLEAAYKYKIIMFVIIKYSEIRLIRNLLILFRYSHEHNDKYLLLNLTTRMKLIFKITPCDCQNVSTFTDLWNFY